MWDNICDYDEGYTKADAEDFGWCRTCKISSCRKSKCHSSNNVMYMSPNDYAKIIDKNRYIATTLYETILRILTPLLKQRIKNILNSVFNIPRNRFSVHLYTQLASAIPFNINISRNSS